MWIGKIFVDRWFLSKLAGTLLNPRKISFQHATMALAKKIRKKLYTCAVSNYDHIHLYCWKNCKRIFIIDQKMSVSYGEPWKRSNILWPIWSSLDQQIIEKKITIMFEGLYTFHIVCNCILKSIWSQFIRQKLPPTMISIPNWLQSQQYSTNSCKGPE